MRGFFAFWVDFIIGDDPIVAVGVVIALAVTGLLAHNDVTAWWLVPVATAILLTASLVRAARKARSAQPD